VKPMTYQSPFDKHISPPPGPPPVESLRGTRSGPRNRPRAAWRFVRNALTGAIAVVIGVVIVHVATQPTLQAPVNLTSVEKLVSPAVVDVNVQLGYDNGGAAGTGMVIRSDGIVLTNNHVVDGATNIQVADIGNGRTFSATVLGTDVSDDIAVLQIHGAPPLAVVTIGSSAHLSVGNAVAAVGNAGGVGGAPSLARGHITGLGQQITAVDDLTGTSEHLTGLLQTDAPIQPGDSGGPIVDAQSRVIAMTTAAVSTGHSAARGSRQTNSAGFALPIDRVMRIAQQILHHVSSSHVHIGPTAFLGVQISQDTPQGTVGVVISGTLAGTPAQRVGLRAGDVITSVNGVAVESPTALTRQMQRLSPGQRVIVEWNDRSGQPHRSTVQLATGPSA